MKDKKIKKELQEIALDFVKNKDIKTFSFLVKRMTPGLHKHIMEIEKNNARRADIINDVFSKVWDKLYQYDENIGNFSTWVYKIARNEALKAKNYERRFSYFEDLTIDKKYQVLEKVGHRDYDHIPVISDEQRENGGQIIDDLYELVKVILEKIPNNKKYVNMKRAFVLKDFEHLPFDEVGRVMNEPPNTVKGWVCKARRHISKIIQEEYAKEYETYLEYKKQKTFVS